VSATPVRSSAARDLDRDVAIKLRITRPVDLAHAAHTDERGNPERSETRSWSEIH
jgi:hypothetical protein